MPSAADHRPKFSVSTAIETIAQSLNPKGCWHCWIAIEFQQDYDRDCSSNHSGLRPESNRIAVASGAITTTNWSESGHDPVGPQPSSDRNPADRRNGKQERDGEEDIVRTWVIIYSPYSHTGAYIPVTHIIKVLIPCSNFHNEFIGEFLFGQGFLLESYFVRLIVIWIPYTSKISNINEESIHIESTWRLLFGC